MQYRTVTVLLQLDHLVFQYTTGSLADHPSYPYCILFPCGYLSDSNNTDNSGLFELETKVLESIKTLRKINYIRKFETEK